MSDQLSPCFGEESSSVSTLSSSSIPYRQNYYQQRSFVLVYIVVASVCINIVLVGLFIFTSKSWINGKDRIGDKSWSYSAGSVCFTCDHLGPEIESNDTFYDVIKLYPGHALCCLSGISDVTALFQKIISDKFKQLHSGLQLPSSKFFNYNGFRPTGAHLYMKPRGVSPPVWTTIDPYNTAFCSGVVCREGAITILEKGRYLVYSHITVKQDHSLYTNNNLLHYIRRNNPHLSGLRDNPILFSKSSPISFQQNHSFLSAIVQLRSQDILQVTVSEEYYKLLDKDFFSNYFGVIKM